MSGRKTRRILYRIGIQAFFDRVKLAWAGSAVPRSTPQWRGLLAFAEAWQRPTFPITGDDVLAMGVASGPAVGAVMREAEDWWVDEDFPADRDAALERAKAVAVGMGLAE